MLLTNIFIVGLSFGVGIVVGILGKGWWIKECTKQSSYPLQLPLLCSIDKDLLLQKYKPEEPEKVGSSADLCNLLLSATVTAHLNKLRDFYEEWTDDYTSDFSRSFGLCALDLAQALDGVSLQLYLIKDVDTKHLVGNLDNLLSAWETLQTAVNRLNGELRSLHLLNQKVI